MLRYKFTEGEYCNGVFIDIQQYLEQLPFEDKYKIDIAVEILFPKKDSLYRYLTLDETVEELVDLLGAENVKFTSFNFGYQWLDAENNPFIIFIKPQINGGFPRQAAIPFESLFKFSPIKLMEQKIGVLSSNQNKIVNNLLTELNIKASDEN